MKLRLDKALVERGLTASRARAQQRIANGEVSVAGTVVTKAGFLVDAAQSIDLHGEGLPYVSRGGLKLAAALDHWKIDLRGRSCLDIGISTGGFTDCMLQRGAAQVTGIDSGCGQLAPALQNHPRLQLLEKTNARYLEASMLPENISFIAMDVSFIAASLVLPAVIEAAFTGDGPSGGREVVILVKPQFEAGREAVGAGGIVRSRAAHARAVERVRQTVCSHGARETSVIDSPIQGRDGNREFLLYARF